MSPLDRFRAYRSDIGIGTPYMERWILQTPWFTLRLHHILRSDDDRALHDHPWPFLSLLLTGGYREIRPSIPNTSEYRHAYIDGYVRDLYAVEAERGPHIGIDHPRFSFVFRRATDAHRLILSRPIWTLVLSGPRERGWGFYVPGRGWVPWRDYVREYGGEDHHELAAGSDGRRTP